MSNEKNPVSGEIGVLIEQHLHAHRQQESRQEKQKRWAKRVSDTVEALRRCTPDALVDELLKRLRTQDIGALEAELCRIVQERWQPAAAAVDALVGLPAFRRIPFAPHPLFEALFLLFSRLVERPEDASLPNRIASEVAALIWRTEVDPHDLFGLFSTYQGEFELLRLPRELGHCAPWFVGPDPRGQYSGMEHDPRIVAIRIRLSGKRAEVAISAFKKLCADGRSEVPRPELIALGIAPTTVDRACLSPNDRRERDDGQIVYRREFVIEYVCNKWRPRTNRSTSGEASRAVKRTSRNS